MGIRGGLVPAGCRSEPSRWRGERLVCRPPGIEPGRHGGIGGGGPTARGDGRPAVQAPRQEATKGPREVERLGAHPERPVPTRSPQASSVQTSSRFEHQPHANRLPGSLAPPHIGLKHPEATRGVYRSSEGVMLAAESIGRN